MPLHWAVSKGHEAVVAQLLAAGAAVNQADSEGYTPLHWAVSKGHRAVVAQLLAAGAAVNQADSEGYTPLHSAARDGHEAIVEQLLAAGAAVNHAGSLDKTALHEAAENGHEAVVGRLLAAGAAVNQPDRWSYTPLYSAARDGHEAIVEQLLAAGAAVNQTGENGKTPLFWAIERKHTETIMLLAHHTFKALKKHETENLPEAGGAQAANAQSSGASEKTQSEQLKDQLEKLLTESPDLFRQSQAALLQWIIGKHFGFQDETIEKDFTDNISLDNLNKIILPENSPFSKLSKQGAAYDAGNREAFTLSTVLPVDLMPKIEDYLYLQDPLITLKKQLEMERSPAAATIQRHVPGCHARRRLAATVIQRRAPPASPGGGGGASSSGNTGTAGADESKESPPGRR
jgi:ankyrin repeat protein